MAMQELAALGDTASLPRIRELLAVLKAGCNRGVSHNDDPAARLPWTDT
jgi:hypothetical protein